MPGPPPKRTSRRSSRGGSTAFTTLPGEGRQGEAPEWPLGRDLEMSAQLEQAQDDVASLSSDLVKCTDGRRRGGIQRKLNQAQGRADLLSIKIEQMAGAELALWAELWTTPQAVMWDESAAFARAVAQFVRWNIRAEQGDLRAATESRLRGAELGLTPLSLLRLRREVEETEKAQAEGAKRRGNGGDRPKSDPNPKPDDDPRVILFPGA